jgi:hypothetical protein
VPSGPIFCHLGAVEVTLVQAQMAIIRLTWSDPEASARCTRTFEAADIGAALLAVTELKPETPVQIWVDGKFRAKLTRVLAEEGWYWRIG